jgi:hypothetical protein
MLLKLVVSVFALAGFSTSLSTGIPASSVSWWIVSGLEKVRPADPVPSPPERSARLEAARNEFEPFQLVLSTASADTERIDVEASDLSGPQGAVIPARNVRLYLERNISLQLPSSVDRTAGEWPDPLVPRIDAYAGERRNAFPFELERGHRQVIWAEVYVPKTAAAGKYTGELRIRPDGLSGMSVPVQLTVWDFELPSTSSLRTAFGFSGVTALRKHRGSYTSDDDLFRISRDYQKAALMHRLSTYGGTMVSPPASFDGNSVRVDWTVYDREEGPFLDGAVFGAGDPLPGAKVTSADMRTRGQTDEQKVLYWREWVRHFKEKGWSDRLYFYLWDEPAADAVPRVLAKGKLVRQADSSIRNLLTMPFDRRLAEVVDIWTPLINCFETKPGFPDYCARNVSRAEYEPLVKEGKSLWWYQSCASHSCNSSKSEYFRGWPSYAIDAGAVSNRVMQWITWKYGIGGNLYYNMNESYIHPADPWSSVYLHGGNGDGSLFYPGTPEKIGGATDIPIESIRLKLIREGLEDYEYLAALAARGERRFADECASRIARKTYDWDSDPKELLAVRHRMGERLNASRAMKQTAGGGSR